MARSVTEWKGKTDDTPVPDRVRLRVFDRKKGRCHKCTRLIHAGEKWTCEHLVAIINGGKNHESNLDLTCCNCLPGKNAADVAEKSDTYDKRRKHVLPKAQKYRWPSRPMTRTRSSNARDINSDRDDAV